MADTTRFNSASRSGDTSGSTGTGTPGGVDPERMIESAKNMGTQVVGTVRDQATSLLDEQRNRAADQIVAVAGMVRDSVQSLDRKSAGTICRYAEDTAQQIEGIADTLRNRSWDELAGDAEDFARRWPGVFIAAAVGLGFLAGRFLVSSGSRTREDSRPTQSTSMTATGATSDQPQGGARHDYGAVGGSVSSSAKSGYGSTGSTENF